MDKNINNFLGSSEADAIKQRLKNYPDATINDLVDWIRNSFAHTANLPDTEIRKIINLVQNESKCSHPYIVKEVIFGQRTGDYICSECKEVVSTQSERKELD